jgi:hypothetical protein
MYQFVGRFELKIAIMNLGGKVENYIIRDVANT